MPPRGADLGLEQPRLRCCPRSIGLESMGVPSPGRDRAGARGGARERGQAQHRARDRDRRSRRRSSATTSATCSGALGREVFVAPGPLQKRRKRRSRPATGSSPSTDAKAVFFGRWIALVRFAAAWLAGINKMHFRTSSSGTRSAASAGRSTYGLVGYFGGKAAARRAHRRSASTRRSRSACWSLRGWCSQSAVREAPRACTRARPPRRRRRSRRRKSPDRAEVERAGVDAVTLPGRRRAVVEHVAEVAAAALAEHLGAGHEQSCGRSASRRSRRPPARRSSASRCPSRTWCPS